MRVAKSFSLDRRVFDYIQSTRRRRSSSERANELLRKAMLHELYESLDQEAAEFFSSFSKMARTEAKAFQSASLRSWTRD